MDRKTFITGLMALGTLPAATGSLLSALPASAADAPPAKEPAHDLRYTANEITQAGSDFFGITTEAMAKAVQRIFGDLGEPDAYIKGEEGSGAFVVGLRYGSGYLIRKTREGRTDEIRPCIACSQGCNSGALYAGRMLCTVNPVVGYEKADEYGLKPIQGGMHVTDLHATLLALMGLNHEKLTYRYAGRDFRLTDVAGNVATEIFA